MVGRPVGRYFGKYTDAQVGVPADAQIAIRAAIGGDAVRADARVKKGCRMSDSPFPILRNNVNSAEPNLFDLDFCACLDDLSL